MIKVGEVFFYIGLNQKWSAAKVEATGDHIVLNRKLFTSFGGNLNCNSSDILFFNLDIYRGINTQWPVSWKLLFIRKNPIIGTWLLPTGDSLTISEYTNIFDILLIERGNFACIYLFESSIINSKVRFPGVFCTINCDPKPSSCRMERSA